MPDICPAPLPPSESWMKKIVHAANLIPLVDLKPTIKAQAGLLPDLLRADGGVVPKQRKREALLSMQLMIGRLLTAMRLRGRFDTLPHYDPQTMTAKLIEAATDLPRVLEEDGEFDRGIGLHRVKVLCHRLLATMLALLLLGTCPLCQITSETSHLEFFDCDHVSG